MKIGNDVEVLVAEIGRKGVRLAIVAPRSVQVMRGEVYDAIVAANTAASHVDEGSLPPGPADARPQTTSENPGE